MISYLFPDHGDARSVDLSYLSALWFYGSDIYATTFLWIRLWDEWCEMLHDGFDEGNRV